MKYMKASANRTKGLEENRRRKYFSIDDEAELQEFEKENTDKIRHSYKIYKDKAL